MAYDIDLADRIRALLSERDDVTEQAMFGGLAFLVGGHLAVGATRDGGIMVRVDPGQTATLLATTAATPMVMRGKELDGWVRVGAEDLRTARQLTTWVRRGASHASSLPPKDRARRSRR